MDEVKEIVNYYNQFGVFSESEDYTIIL